MSEIKLKPCPFCGSESVKPDKTDDGLNHYTRCFGCGLLSPWFADKKKLIEYWNGRADNG